MGKLKQPTTTRLVMEVLRGCGDFRTQRMLVEETGRSVNQVSAALYHLRQVRAVDVVVQPDGGGWWYALPPEGDARTRTLAEIQAEIHKRRRPRKPV